MENEYGYETKDDTKKGFIGIIIAFLVFIGSLYIGPAIVSHNASLLKNQIAQYKNMNYEFFLNGTKVISIPDEVILNNNNYDFIFDENSQQIHVYVNTMNPINY